MMARRRKSNGNAKTTKDTKTKPKNELPEKISKKQVNRKPAVKKKISSQKKGMDTTRKNVARKKVQKSTKKTVANKVHAIKESESNIEFSPDAKKETETYNNENPHGSNDVSASEDNSDSKLQPLDIQQMILGDLQNAGKGDEIIVSRQSGVDVSEDDVEGPSPETGRVMELPKEEYDLNTEEEEEEEVILMTEEDDGEEIQYAIVVNSDFDMTDGSDQEMVNIHNLSDFQEGSCEIITVVRESDYDSSQESVDGVDEGGECDNITAVIGSVDSIHCVNISQYNSEDESSNHDDSFEKEEIKVTEHEVACFSQMDNSLNVLMVDSSNSHLLAGTLPQINDCTEEEPSNVLHFDNVNVNELEGSTTQDNNDKADNDTLFEINKSTIMDEKLTSNIVLTQENKNNNNIATGSQIKLVDKDLIYEKKTTIKETDFDNFKSLPRKAKMNKQSTNSYSSTDLDSKKQLTSVNKANNDIYNNIISAGISIDERKDDNIENKCKKPLLINNRSPDSSGDSELIIEINMNKENSSNGDEKTVILKVEERKLNSLQEQKVTSNSSGISQEVGCTNSNPNRSDYFPLPKEENNLPFLFSVDNNSSSIKIENKLDTIKEESSAKDEEYKQNSFRSRSGSTDTTGSESGSNSSSSRRRSGRIRSICATKQSDTDPTSKGNIPFLGVVTSTTSTPPVPGYERDKPVKVKSRWRRSSELEMGSTNKKQQELEVMSANARLQETIVSTQIPKQGQPSTPPYTPPPDKDGEDILETFNHLESNEYLTDRSKSKEAKRMVCDCTLTKEEISRGDMGCGEDCLNRLLMIECGVRCMLGERCANKRFQNLEYAKCEVFKTEMKGYGLRALHDISVDTFLLEYVGEVIDPKEFRRRAKDYSKDKNLHFYFMALKSDAIIDATQKGNISRFINHSCDPNAETQKWTVNGELRIGFFSKRAISAGEEITFDYQLQRYGKEAQKCYCQSALCRGWIGENPEKENKWSDLTGRGRERRERERKKKEDKRISKDMLNDIDLEEEIDKLVLKNRAQTLLLCRLMVRAEDHSSRVQLLRILQKGEPACLRLFLDYHGLRLIWSWMMDPASTTGLKVEILETLARLPIPNKTMLQDSKVLSVVEKWSTAAQNVAEAKDRSSTEEEQDKGESDKDKPIKGLDTEKVPDDSNSSRPKESEEQQEKNKKKIIEIANTLLKDWLSLKEVFRIPKKERIEQMKEHEREAESSYRAYSFLVPRSIPQISSYTRYLSVSHPLHQPVPCHCHSHSLHTYHLSFSNEMCRDGSVEKQDKTYDRHRHQDRYRNDYDRRDKEKDRDRDRDRDRKRSRDSPDCDKARKSAKVDDKQAQMLKMERRHLFAIKAAQEDEERQRRQQQESIWHEQVQIAAHELAAAQNQQAQQHVVQQFAPPQQWMPFPPTDPNMMPPQHQHMEGQPIYHNSQPPPPFMFNQGGPHPPSHMAPPFHEPAYHNPMFNHPPPMAKQPLLPTSNQPLLGNPPLPNQPLLRTPNPHLLPNPPLSNPSFISNPQNQPLLPTPPLPNQPHPISMPTFTQPPLPNQPPPMVMTSQPPPIVIAPPATSMGFPQDNNPPQHFQNPIPNPMQNPMQNPMPPPNQFAQPPPFTAQPPLPIMAPAQNPQPVFQSPLPAQFQPPLPQPTPAPAVVPVTTTVAPVPVPMYLPTPVRLPPKWKSAKDGEGRTYYYHIKTRISQWTPPVWEHQQQQLAQESESESDSSDSDDEDYSSEDEEQDDEKVTMMEEDPEPVEDIINEDLGVEELGDSPYEPETMELLEDIVEDTKKKRKDVLVQERIISSQLVQVSPLSSQPPRPIPPCWPPEPPAPVKPPAIPFTPSLFIPPPPRTADEIPDKLDKKKIRELKEKLKRQKVKDRQRLKQKSSKSKGRSSTSKCEADTSSDPGRKIKDAFRLNMAGVIVHYLNAYRKPDCKFGKITKTDDFKHLARKLTHFVMLKELKHCRSVDELECNDNVKHKARDFIKKYMAKFGPLYQRPSDDD